MRGSCFLTLVASAAAAAGDFSVRFTTNVPGDFVVNVTHAWAPIGADQFRAEIEGGFYSTPAAFFQVIPDLVVQFGISGTPSMNSKRNPDIKVDTPVQSNKPGTIVYNNGGVGPSQLFVNIADMSAVFKGPGYAPFGTVVEGLDIFKNMHSRRQCMHPCQEDYTVKGQDWIEKQYPGVKSITGANIEASEAIV